MPDLQRPHFQRKSTSIIRSQGCLVKFAKTKTTTEKPFKKKKRKLKKKKDKRGRRIIDYQKQNKSEPKAKQNKKIKQEEKRQTPQNESK